VGEQGGVMEVFFFALLLAAIIWFIWFKKTPPRA
jgi:hypothetical protein